MSPDSRTAPEAALPCWSRRQLLRDSALGFGALAFSALFPSQAAPEDRRHPGDVLRAPTIAPGPGM